MNFGKILVVSPHMDDEILGCGGVLANNTGSDILYVTGYHPLIENKIYREENQRVVSVLKANGLYMQKTIEHTNNIARNVSESELISGFEDVFLRRKPDTVFLCFPSYNQDHRIIFDTAMTAMRPHDKNWFVKNILVYEQPETLHTNRLVTEQFVPNVFVEIDIETKLNLYSLYESQNRGHRSKETIRALAILRGSFIGKPFAESFSCVRMTL